MSIPHSPHAPTDPGNPRPVGFCDRCEAKYPLDQLQYQSEWSGAGLVNTGWRVCPRCLDKPNETLRSIRIPADPAPLRDPRPGFTATHSPVEQVETINEILDV